MVIENKIIEDQSLTWLLRYPTKYDAIELSKLRLKIET